MGESAPEAARISLQDVEAAQRRVGRRVRRTPQLPSDTGVSLKCEFLQHTGSFKARGAFNRLLAAQERDELDPSVGVVVASGGNAGLAYAYAAVQLAVPVTVFVPTTAPEVKVRRLHAYGASVQQTGQEYADAQEAAVAFAQSSGALLGHAYDEADMAAGAGTMALEMLEDQPDLDTVVLSVGGGGLLAGVLAGLDGRARVVAVEPFTAPSLREALAAGRPVDVPVSGVAADSLGACRIGEIGFDLARRAGVSSILVSDDDIVAARLQLWQEYRVAAEHGAAASLAALTSNRYRPSTGERVCVLICGANTDPSTLTVLAGSQDEPP